MDPPEVRRVPRTRRLNGNISMSTMQRTAWLFTRDQESVRVELLDTLTGVQLTIDGPGAASATHDFPAGTSMDSFRHDYEQKLLADGFTLQVVAERRTGARPAKPERRKK